MHRLPRSIPRLVLAFMCVCVGRARGSPDDLLVCGIGRQSLGQFYVVELGAGRSAAISGPFQTYYASMEILPGNRHLVVLWQPLTSGPVFSLFERDTGIFLPLAVPPLRWGPTSVLVDQEGDLLSTEGFVGGLHRLDRKGRWIRLPPSFWGECVVDIDTGDIVGVDRTATLARYRPWSGDVIGITTRIAHQLGWRMIQDPETGDFLLWDGSVAQNEVGNLLRVSAAGVVTSRGVLPWILRGLEVFPDSAGREYVFSAGCPPGWCNVVPAIYGLDRSWSQITTLYPLPLDPRGLYQWGPMDVLRDRSRKLSTATTGIQNTWDLFVDFPGDAGLPYVVLLGISGIRPGVTLPDGRKIRLNPDAVTFLAYTGQLEGFTGLLGTLDENGKSQATMNVTWLPPGARGRSFWAVGLTLRAGAPGGIGSVSDPIVLQIR